MLNYFKWKCDSIWCYHAKESEYITKSTEKTSLSDTTIMDALEYYESEDYANALSYLDKALKINRSFDKIV